MYTLNLSLFYFFFDLSGHSLWSDDVIILFAEYLPYLIVLGVVIAVYHFWRLGQKNIAYGYMLAIISGGVARGVASIIRLFYHHPRPPQALHITSLFPETSYSFPSGHAIFFFALATSVYFINKGWGKILFALSILIGLARIAAGVHWPFDIIGGAVLGVIISIIIQKIWKRYEGFNSKHF
ncbi:MAG: undecaprenyl-diphosphatase [Candidatus Taylorbacteria bacterium]|nr:undecaprenyl-diphosphatase [Candidatus Taylorbacteria bacterium]